MLVKLFLKFVDGYATWVEQVCVKQEGKWIIIIGVVSKESLSLYRPVAIIGWIKAMSQPYGEKIIEGKLHMADI